MTTPVLRGLREKYGAVHLTYESRNPSAELLQHNPLIDRLETRAVNPGDFEEIIELNGAYENSPHRTSKHAVDIFCEHALVRPSSRQLVLGLTDEERAAAAATLAARCPGEGPLGRDGATRALRARAILARRAVGAGCRAPARRRLSSGGFRGGEGARVGDSRGGEHDGEDDLPPGRRSHRTVRPVRNGRHGPAACGRGAERAPGRALWPHRAAGAYAPRGPGPRPGAGGGGRALLASLGAPARASACWASPPTA